MLLALSSASPATIAHDYALSRIGTEPYRGPLTAHLLAFLKMTAEEAAKLPGMLDMSGTHDWVIVRFLEWMETEWCPTKDDGLKIPADVRDEKGRRWPGVEAWLCKELGFSADDVEKMRRNLGET